MTCKTRRSRCLSAALLASAIACMTAAPASAFLKDFKIQSAATPFNSITQKAGLVSVVGCGVSYFGGGASISPQLSNLGLTGAKPFGGYQFGGTETDSESGKWKVDGRGYCATSTATPPPAGNARTYFKALEIRSKTTSTNSAPVKTAIARCPVGKQAIGGGAEISDVSDVAFWSLGRVENGRSYRAVAHEVDATGANWNVEAQAICANITTETATNNYLTNQFTVFNPSTPSNSDSPKTLTRTCPGGAFPYVVGGGALVHGDAEKVVITRSSAGSSGLSNTWTAVARETDPTGEPWFLSATIVCTGVNGGPPA